MPGPRVGPTDCDILYRPAFFAGSVGPYRGIPVFFKSPKNERSRALRSGVLEAVCPFLVLRTETGRKNRSPSCANCVCRGPTINVALLREKPSWRTTKIVALLREKPSWRTTKIVALLNGPPFLRTTKNGRPPVQIAFVEDQQSTLGRVALRLAPPRSARCLFSLFCVNDYAKDEKKCYIVTTGKAHYHISTARNT